VSSGSLIFAQGEAAMMGNKVKNRAAAAGAFIQSEELDLTKAQLLYTIPAAARMLQIGRTSLYKSIGKKFIRPIYLGRSIRIHRSEIERIAREGLPE
jgi:excisionase family DNA binding protein